MGHQQQEKLAAGPGIDEQINPSFGIFSLPTALHVLATAPALSCTFAFGSGKVTHPKCPVVPYPPRTPSPCALEN